MGLDEKRINEIKQIKIQQFLKPLLYNLQEEESGISKTMAKIKEIDNFNFKQSFLFVSDIQVYRTLSIFGIVKNFDRSIKYRVVNLSMILDIWYSSMQGSSLHTKDEIRTCDILILHGKNDTSFGDKKASVLVDIINERNSFGKLTWIFIDGTTLDGFNHYQPGVSTEIKNTLQVEFKKGGKINVKSAIKKSADTQKHMRKNDEII